MKRNLSEVPLSSWQFFHAAHKNLGIKFLTLLYRRGQRQIYRWAADPAVCGEKERNPIDRLSILLSSLCEIGKEDIARAGVQILAEVVGCEIRCVEFPEPDQETIEGECLDDYPALMELHEAIRMGQTVKHVEHLKRQAQQEIEETAERYRRSRQK